MGPLALSLFAFAFDYTPGTITSSESAVVWRRAFGSAYSGEPHHSRACSMLGNSAMISRSRGHSPSRTMGPPRATNWGAILRHCWQQHPSVILEPNRIFDRKTCNDIHRHGFLLYRVIDDFAVRSS